MALTVLAAYDVREDAARSRLAAILQGFGDRVQKSVFVLGVSEEDLELIRAKAEALLDLDVDSFLLVRVCGSCWDQIEQIGQAQVPEPVLFWSVW
ncbi:MAG: CRISPR-associated endonuclease Cas2 [Actinomycetia bacterium]|nr:CRISPR-associated endonuclease Cas2 [Actinomycetes bacterium]